jgi:hypothetical protein
MPRLMRPALRHRVSVLLAISTMLYAVGAGPVMGQNAAELFLPIVAVLLGPRCLNCHTDQNFPLQGDDSHRHAQNVVRGDHDDGVGVMRCSLCHGETNYEPSGVPGATGWSLAPTAMAWNTLDADALRRRLTDRSANGNRCPKDLVAHMNTDPRVLWGWDPGGGRKPVPVRREEFMQSLRAWAEAEATCPP